MGFLFDDLCRTDTSPMRQSERYFEFYNRSANEVACTTRDTLEQLIRDYPQTEREELRARMRCGDDMHFKSSAFELLLFSALLRAGCIVEPHPVISEQNTKRPDFLVTSPDGKQFYLEAVLGAQTFVGEDRSGLAKINSLFCYINQKPHQNFWIDLEYEGYPQTQPSSKKLLSFIHRWLDSLDHDRTRQSLENSGLDEMPITHWEHEGWGLKITALPLSSEMKGCAESLIGSYPTQSGLLDTWRSIRDTLKDKGSKYGELSMPLVVAVNVNSFILRDSDILQALYGEETMYSSQAIPRQTRMKRARNGLWLGKRGPQYTRISAAWIFDDLSVPRLGVAKQRLFLNPWTVHPAPEILKQFPFADAPEGRMEWHDGKRLCELFGLSESWPFSNDIASAKRGQVEPPPV